MGCVDHLQDEDIRCEQTWQINKTSGVLQLKKLVPLNILYQSQHANAVGKIWEEHHRKFAKFLNKFSPNSVLELGGGHGILSVEYAFLQNIPWTILEPNPAPIPGCKAEFIRGFFDEKFIYARDFDAVVHSHVFEHIYNPSDFMCYLGLFMTEGKKLIFSLPNMRTMLERRYANCLNFEHTVFLSEEYIEFLLTKYGFRLLEKEYYRDDHSIFYAAVRDTQIKPKRLRSDLYDGNKKLYLDFIEHHKTLISDLNLRMSKSNQPVYLFGAHIFSQFLLEMGLSEEKIICILDNDPQKQNLRLYGTRFLVSHPEILRNVESPVVILRAGVYSHEIRDKISQINPEVEYY
jgi:Methyltransferase domain/C-methyltransferase C-terminal domain